MIFTGTKENVYIRKEFNFFETDTSRPFHCSGRSIGNLNKDDENVKTSAYFGHFRNEKRTGVELHASRNCILGTRQSAIGQLGGLSVRRDLNTGIIS